MRNADPVVDLMTISDRSTLARPAMPSQWRLAAFDVYDGQRWVPSIDLRPIGGVLGTVPADDSSRHHLRGQISRRSHRSGAVPRQARVGRP